MKVTVLIENTCSRPGCVPEHGLSLYVQTPGHNLLMDAGAGPLFARNAAAVGLSLAAVDTFVLSHGHNDHGGGLGCFLEQNRTATVYAQRSAFEPHFGASGRSIGLDGQLLHSDRLTLPEGNLTIDSELSLFTGVRGRRLFPRGSSRMTVLRAAVPVPDDFRHEQYLVVSGPEGNVLFSGCAHNGILNILDAYDRLYGAPLRAVFSGFHMLLNAHTYEPYTPGDIADIQAVARELGQRRTLFYTGHCTGAEAFGLMQPFMPKNLFRLSTGMTVEV